MPSTLIFTVSLTVFLSLHFKPHQTIVNRGAIQIYIEIAIAILVTQATLLPIKKTYEPSIEVLRADV